jgi:hypothetical protein
MRNPKTDVMVRRRFEEFGKEKINQFKTSEERRKLAAKIIDYLNQRIADGWSIFDTSPTCLYEDELQYASAAKIYKQKVESNSNYTYWCSRYIRERLQDIYDSKGETLRTYRSRYRVFEQWLIKQKLDKVDFSAIDNPIILQFFLYLKNERNLCSRTYSSYVFLLKELFDYAIKQGGVHENPVHSIPPNRNERDMGAERIIKTGLDNSDGED